MSITLALLLILAVVVLILLVNASSRSARLGGAGTTRVVERDAVDPRPAPTERVVERVVERDVDDPNPPL